MAQIVKMQVFYFADIDYFPPGTLILDDYCPLKFKQAVITMQSTSLEPLKAVSGMPRSMAACNHICRLVMLMAYKLEASSIPAQWTTIVGKVTSSEVPDLSALVLF